MGRIGKYISMLSEEDKSTSITFYTSVYEFHYVVTHTTEHFLQRGEKYPMGSIGSVNVLLYSTSVEHVNDIGFFLMQDLAICHYITEQRQEWNNNNIHEDDIIIEKIHLVLQKEPVKKMNEKDIKNSCNFYYHVKYYEEEKHPLHCLLLL